MFDVIDPWAALSSVGIFFLVFFIAREITKAIQISEFDDFGFMNIVVAISASAIAYWRASVYFPDYGVLEFASTVSSFYLGIFVCLQLIKRELNLRRIKDELLEAASSDRALLFAGFALVIFCLVGGFFAVLQFGANSPDERMLFNSKFRLFDVLRTGATIVFSYVFFVQILGAKKNKLKWFFVPFVAITMFSGAKGALVNFVQDFMIAKGSLRGRRNYMEDLRQLMIYGTLAICFGILVLMRYFGNLADAVRMIMLRMVLSGDIYIVSYVTTDYRLLFGKYNPLLYIFHPFLKLIGLQGYEYPLGCALMELAIGNSDFGPNAHFTMLSLVFAQGRLFTACTLCFIGGLGVVFFKFLAIRLLKARRLPPVWRISLFFGVFQSGILFLDLGLYEQRLVCLVLVLLVISGAFELMGGRYRAKALKSLSES
jgi:hypothetical protein